MRNATAAEIKAAHRRLAHRHHPDKGGKSEAFDIIQRAWFTLSDADRRSKYDETGEWDGPTPDNSMGDAWNLITHHLVATLCAGNAAPQAWDVRIAIIQKLDAQIREARGTLETSTRAVARATLLIGKFRSKSRSSEHMDGALNSLLRDNETVRKHVENIVKVATRAKELLHDLEVEQLTDRLALYGRGTSAAYTSHFFTKKT